MKRAVRVLLVIFVIFAILITLGFAARKYLTSGQVALQVGSRLEAVYGAPVRVGGADIGLGSSSFTGVQLFEKGEAASRAPWATVAAVEADVSGLSVLAASVSPKSLIMTGAAVTLRFNREGRLLTQLPGWPAGEPGKRMTVPNLRIQGGRLTLQREGAADLVITDVNLTLTSQDDQLVLAGDADGGAHGEKSGWGKWTLQGVLDRQTKNASVTLRSDGVVHVTQAMLTGLPFVPANIWQAVQVEGNTPAVVTMRYGPADQVVHYRVELEPRETAVHVPGIGLDAARAGGKVVIDDGLVELRKVRGEAFEGTIQTNADLDFRGALTRLEFAQVEAQGLNVQRLPASWGLPLGIQGHLKGSARLEVALGSGKPQTRGEGHGEIDDARIGGQPTSEPIGLELHPREGGFDFRDRKANPVRQTRPKDEDTPYAARLVDDLVKGLLGAIREFTVAMPRAVGALTRKTLTRRRPGEPPRYVEVSLSMRHVDLALLAKGLGLKLPFTVGGRLSYRVQASIPLDTPADFKTYRVKGTVQATQLRLADIELEELRGKVDYAKGVLSLPDVTGRVSGTPAPGKRADGTLQGAVRLQLVPLGELTTDMKLDRIPLSRVAPLLGSAGRMDGDFSATVVARVPASKLESVNAWESTAKITVPRLHLFGWTFQDGAAEVRLRDGVLSSTNLRVQLEGAAMAGSVELLLADPYRYRFEGKTLGGRFDLNGQMPPIGAESRKENMQGRLRVQRVRLAEVGEIFHIPPDKFPLRGLVDLEIDFHHEGPNRAPVGGGHLVLTRPRWGNREVAESLQGEVLLTRRELRLRDITASVGEGILHGQLGMNLERLEQSWFTLSLEGVEASWVAEAWPELAGRVQGMLEAHLRGRIGREWSGSGDLFLSRGKVLGAEVAEWRLPLTWNFAPGEGRGEIAVRDSSARLASGHATGEATFLWELGLRMAGHVRFVDLELRALLQAAADATQVSGRLTGSFDFAGSDVRSMEDLTATLEATLVQTQPFQFPVLKQVAPFLGIQASSTFENGEVRSRLARGMFHIQSLSLRRSPLQVTVAGNVALAGRLDLDVTAETGLDALAPAGLARLRLPVQSAIPLRRLRVTGTAQNPSIRNEPLPLLTR